MAENEFLKGIKTSQFIKESNDQIKRNLSSVMSNTTKAFSANAAVQVESLSALQSIDKSIGALGKYFEHQSKMLSQGFKTLKSPTEKFFKKDDPDDDMRQNIADIEALIAEGNDMEKKKTRKKISFFDGLMDVGKKLAIGGLVGYVLTGKGEIITKLRKGLFDAGAKVFTAVGDGVTYWYNDMGGKKQLQSAGAFIAKGIGSAVTYAFDENIAVGKSMIMGLKLKSALKLGNIFKGLKQLTQIPKVIKGAMAFTKSLSRVVSKGGVKMGGKFAFKALGKGASKTALKKIPVLGALIGTFFGIQRFRKGDIVGGLLEVGSGVASIFPGIGTAISLGIDGLLMMNDIVGKENLTQRAVKALPKVGKMVLRNIPVVGTIMDIMEAIKLSKAGKHKAAAKLMARGFVSVIPGAGVMFDMVDKAFSFFSKNKKEAGDIASGGMSAKPHSGGLFSKLFGGNESMERDLDLPSVNNLGVKHGVDLGGLNMGMPFSSFEDKVLSAYHGVVGKGYQPVITSGIRSKSENSRVSGNVKSKHMIGRALDLRTKDITEAEGRQVARALKAQLGDDYGVLQHGSGNNRHIHIQSNEAGDNMPQEAMEEKVTPEKTMQVTLTSEDITALAEAFGVQMQKNTPKFSPSYSTGQTANVRGSY